MLSRQESRRRRRTTATTALPNPAARPSPSHGAISIAAAGSCPTGADNVEAITEPTRRSPDELPVLTPVTRFAAPPPAADPETGAEPPSPPERGVPATGTGRDRPPKGDTAPE